jgi:hypothetical protein
VSKDQRTVELILADMRPAMQMQIRYDLESRDSVPLRGEIQCTVHVTRGHADSERPVR